LIIRELSKIAQDVLIMTSSLTQDLTGKAEYFFKTGSVRALGSIIDVNMIFTIITYFLAIHVDVTRTLLQAVFYGQ
jgi:coatomer protein complex subunit gamma